MDANTAIRLINEELVYKPEWNFAAEDYSWRMQDAILLNVNFTAHDSDRDNAAQGYTRMIEPLHNAFPILVGACQTEEDLMAEVLKIFIRLETHEAREFLRRKPTFDAPFHPHRLADMQAAERAGLSTVADDLSFGAYARRPASRETRAAFRRDDGTVAHYRVPKGVDIPDERRASAFDVAPVITPAPKVPNLAALLPVRVASAS